MNEKQKLINLQADLKYDIEAYKDKIKDLLQLIDNAEKQLLEVKEQICEL